MKGIPIGWPSQRPLPKSDFTDGAPIRAIIASDLLSTGANEILWLRGLSAGNIAISSSFPLSVTIHVITSSGGLSVVLSEQRTRKIVRKTIFQQDPAVINSFMPDILV
jgi:hypothetical protein